MPCQTSGENEWTNAHTYSRCGVQAQGGKKNAFSCSFRCQKFERLLVFLGSGISGPARTWYLVVPGGIWGQEQHKKMKYLFILHF